MRISIGVSLNLSLPLTTNGSPPPDDVFDDFNRPDSTTSIGPLWTAIQGEFGVLNGHAYSVGGGHGARAILTKPIGSPNYAITAVVKGDILRWDSFNFSSPRILCRYIDPTNFMRVDMIQGTMFLAKMDNSSDVDLGNSPTETLRDKYYTVRVECIGDRIKGYSNGVPTLDYQLSAGDMSKYGTADKVGIMLGHSGNPLVPALWDSIRVERL